jgi:hypothetical protein
VRSDEATISMVLEFEVIYAVNRESERHNYRSRLHLSRLTRVLREQGITGRKLEIEALSDGTYRLTIS